LYDLTCELYQEEIERDYHTHLSSTSKRNRLHRSAFIKKKASQILQAVGYLQVVSKYISRKGYNEAIATYIEERTPFVKKEGNKLFLITGGVSEEIEHDKLALHRAIIQLPWNNIYTTNYDELLDVCIDPTIINQLQHQIQLIDEEIASLNIKEVKLLEDLDALEKTPVEPEKDQAKTAGPADFKFESKKTDVPPRNIGQERYDLNYELSNLRRRKEEKEQQVRNLSISINESYHVITYAAGLKLRRNRNIVKLHGSLRSQDERTRNFFEFDGDFKNPYIISGEDYKSYPEKHEAFTQLMRISLLQESFCLVGFSGVDPNFLAWIGWVRDILQKQAAKHQDSPDYKIYLIDIGAAPDTADKLLFFENHSIIRIPVTTTEVLAIIDSGKEHRNISPREAIRLLLKFLAQDHELQPYIPLKDLSSEQDRKSIWRDLHFSEPHKKINPALIKQTLNSLDKLKNNIFLPDINHGYTFNQITILRSASTQLNWYKDDPITNELVCRLVLHALKDYFVPIYSAVETEVVDVMLSFPSVKPQTEALIARYESLKAISNTDDTYEQILTLAYSMCFDALKAKLDAWQPEGKNALKKAGFLAMFDPKAAHALLEEQLNNYDNLNGEERMYGFELLSFSQLSFNWQRDKRLDKTIGQYEHTGFRNISDNFKYLQGEVAAKKPKILPYGKGRFSTGNSVQWISQTKQEMALQYLMLLAESGVQMALSRVNFQSSEDWYPIFRMGFETYPFPFLYYSIQYGSDDFLKRIGQDYAFSEKLVKALPELTTNLFRCLETSPKYIQHHVPYVVAELIMAVDPAVWQADFMRYWKKGVKENFAFLDRNQPETSLFTNGIKCLSDHGAIIAIIRDCLESLPKETGTMGIDFLYHLNFNQHFKKMRRSKATAETLQTILDKLIQNLPGKVDTNLFALGNIYAMLSPEQVAAIKLLLSKEDYTKVRHVRIWHIILYFVYQDRTAVKAIKHAILQHHALWYTGIEGNQISGGVESIDLSTITKSPQNSKGVIWTTKELNVLYKKITDILPQIERVADRHDGFISFTDVLEDMLVFLQFHQSKLTTKTDFEMTVGLTRKLFHQQRNYDSPSQGLLSDDNSPVVQALSEVSKDVRTGYLDPVVIGIVLNKVMLQHQPGLEASLGYLASWISVEKQQEQMKVYVRYYTELLEKYLTRMPDDADIPYVWEKIVTVAYRLRKWNIRHYAIDQWLEKAKASNFNNIRQLVLKNM
jgi:hypothetical protein